MTRCLGLTATAMLLAACSQTTGSPAADAGGPSACVTPFAGNPDAGPELVITTMGVDNNVSDVEDGGRIPLMFPPQGGRVSFVGVRARNVDPCNTQLAGALRDPLSGLVRLDSRPVTLRVAANGEATSVMGVASTWSNIPLCPNQWAQQDLFDHAFQLTISLRERSGRTTTRTLDVTPFCGEPEFYDECRCICREGYSLGDTCEAVDGGNAADAGSQGADGGVAGDAGGQAGDGGAGG